MIDSTKTILSTRKPAAQAHTARLEEDASYRLTPMATTNALRELVKLLARTHVQEAIKQRKEVPAKPQRQKVSRRS